MAQRGMVASLVSLTAFALSLPGVAGAEELKAEVHGSYRLTGLNESDLQLGRRDTGLDAERLGQTTFLEHRLRAGALLTYGALSFDFELDALNGLLDAHCVDGCPGGAQVMSPLSGPDGAPARADVADPLRNRSYGLSLNSLAVRKASVRWRSSAGVFSVGATTSSFGMGMLANAGDRPLFEELGDQHFGDRVVRAFWATKPLAFLSGGRLDEELTTIVGFDLLLQDETGSLVRPAAEWAKNGFTRDRGLAFVLALKHRKGGYSSGLFVTRRSVTSPGATVLDPNVTQPFDVNIAATVVDLFADYRRALGDAADKRELFVAAEGAVVTGATNAVRNASCPGTSDATGCDILQLGGVVRGGVRDEKLSADLMVGFASGDGNPFDAKLTNFRFDRDFKAGLILFDQVMAWQTAAMVRRAGDPALVNVPSAGLELLSSGGAITNALFVQPTVKYRPFAHTQLVGSVLWARAPQAYLDPYWTNRTSAQTNAFGVAAGHSYGFEADLGANYDRELSGNVHLLFGLAGGYFLPGDAFAVDASGKRMDSVYLVKARSAVTF